MYPQCGNMSIEFLDLWVQMVYIFHESEGIMEKSHSVKLRLSESEKEGFQSAAEIAGISLSGWIRERLRRAARIELVDAGKQVPFIHTKKVS